MQVILLTTGILVILFAGSILGAAQGAIHEIEAFILFLISAVLISSAFIVDAINKLRNELRDESQE